MIAWTYVFAFSFLPKFQGNNSVLNDKGTKGIKSFREAEIKIESHE